MVLVELSRLRKNLTIEFAGEAGLDARALRNEFFTMMLQEMNEKFFKGPEHRIVPKNEWELEEGIEMAGMITAQSLLLGIHHLHVFILQCTSE